ncbi:TetR family transcriptional regulator [Caldimonas brevitalea]|uniref:TetR family transcriptional regulator n=1 Tax=Caldimonas brevitalea TaxID=413882 RepID=A0A0G3BP50_9BURK|nr:TetR family transcriptional regulator [Caldimonas brevitalea]
MDAALDLFVEKGFAATKIDDVAARAGVSKGTLYLYFPSKEELLKAVIRHNLSLTIEQGDDVVANFEGSTAELMQVVAGVWWERVGETQASGIFKLILTEARNFPDLAQFYDAEVIEPGQRLITRLLQRGVDRGEFRPTLHLLDTAHSFIFPLLMLCLHKHSIGPCLVHGLTNDPRRFIAHHIELLLKGVTAEPVPAPGTS